MKIQLLILSLLFIGAFSHQATESTYMDMNDLNNDYFLEDQNELEDYQYLENIQNSQFFVQDQDLLQSGEGAVADFDPETGRMFAAFTQAAYCMNSKIEKWNCGKPCKNYPGMKHITVLTNKLLKDNKAFVGYYTSLNMIVVSWKGTISIQNWLEDFDYFKTKYPYCTGCEVHQGFFQAYNSMQDQFWEAYTKLRDQYPTAKLAVTGHSLGAAMSTMNAADIIEHGINGFIWYNFGSPRVGNEAFSTWLQSSYTQRLYRVTHHKDPVPHVPPEDFGFHHLAIEVFYVKSDDPTAQHIICNLSGEDPNCSDQYMLDLDVYDHVSYMGYDYIYNISKCLI